MPQAAAFPTIHLLLQLSAWANLTYYKFNMYYPISGAERAYLLSCFSSIACIPPVRLPKTIIVLSYFAMQFVSESSTLWSSSYREEMGIKWCAVLCASMTQIKLTILVLSDSLAIGLRYVCLGDARSGRSNSFGFRSLLKKNHYALLDNVQHQNEVEKDGGRCRTHQVLFGTFKNWCLGAISLLLSSVQ